MSLCFTFIVDDETKVMKGCDSPEVINLNVK